MKSNKKPKKIFLPFTHQDLELKNELINYARDLKAKQGFENQLAAVFIYASFTEYLGNHLLDNLRYFVHKGSYNQFAGILFIDETNKDEVLTLGRIIDKLKVFSFPDKDGVIDLFEDICEARNNIFHNFAKSDMSGIEKIVTVDIITIIDKTEQLVEKINVIYAGLQTILLPQPDLSEKAKDSNGMAQNIEESEEGKV